ncbi:MAG: phytoene/squalene synthase family protein [Chthonomonadales bacterium]
MKSFLRSSNAPVTREEQLAASYEHCRRIARTHARNFYYSFAVLPPEKRAAMCAVYAFMRHCDDLSDEAASAEAKRAALVSWRSAMDRALAGDYTGDAILPAFRDTVERFQIPPRFFHELLDGAEMDLVCTRYPTFEDLYRYCYRVASTVGFVCIHIWGFAGGDAAYEPAEACGIAFQLTNILRDLKEDGLRGRIYVPQEDLARFGYSEEDLLGGIRRAEFLALLDFEARRAREYYERARPLIPLLHPDGRATFIVMYRIYRELLEHVSSLGYHVLDHRAHVSTARKVGILASAWLGSRVLKA